MKMLMTLGVALLSSQLQAAEPETVIINDFEYTNKYELALRQAKHDDKGKAFRSCLNMPKMAKSWRNIWWVIFIWQGLVPSLIRPKV